MRITWISFALCVWFAASAYARDLTEDEKSIIADAVREQLKNPEDALFQWTPLSGDKALEYCGWVNAKDSSGTYAGYVSFGAILFWRDGKLTEAAVTGMARGDSPNVVLEICRKAGDPP